MKTNKHYKLIQNFTELMENRFSILGFKFGIEPLIGLIPGLGDIISAVFSLYVVYAAVEMGVSGRTVLLMAANIGVDFLIGLVPGVGDIADFVYKANTRNLKLLDKAIKKQKLLED